MGVAAEVREVILKHTGATEELKSETLLEEGLGLTGDDAWELIEDIEERFSVDFSGFEFLKHFSPEAGFNNDEEHGYYPISVQHLIDVAENKHWRLPPRNPENHIRIVKARKRQGIILLTVLVAIALITYWLGSEASVKHESETMYTYESVAAAYRAPKGRDIPTPGQRPGL